MTESGPTRRRQLDATFVALADTLVLGFDLASFLDRLVRACVEVLDCAGAGLLLTDDDGGGHVLAASSDAVRELERLEVANAAGPGLDCLASGSPLDPVRLAECDARWAGFAEAALGQGFLAVETIPLRLRETTIGALVALHTTTPTATAVDRATAQALADVATIGILQQRLIRQGTRLAAQLQTALSSRLVIEQAKGLLAERGGLSIDGAFAALRSYCRSNRVALSDTARSLVQGAIEPDQILSPRASE